MTKEFQQRLYRIRKSCDEQNNLNHSDLQNVDFHILEQSIYNDQVDVI